MSTDCPSSDAMSLTSGQPLANTVVVSDIDRSSSLLIEWERLAGARLFLGPRWLLSWWDHFRQPGDQLHIVTVRDPDGWLIGLAPWYRRQTWWGGNEIQFLGSGEVCSDYLSILAKAGEETTVVRAVSNFVEEAMLGIDRFYLEGIEADDAVMRQFVAAMQSLQFDVSQRECLEGYRLELPTEWEGWLSQLSKSRRNRVRQLWRNQFDTGVAKIHVADETTLDEGFAILVDLHQHRRNQLGQAGCFASTRFHDFLKQAAVEHLKAGQLRLQWIELEGKPVAAELDLMEGDNYLHYCSGMAIDCEHARPGWLGVTAAIRYAIESGRTNFDFLRGDEGYKSHWRGQPVAMINVELVPPKFRAQARYRFRSMVDLAKQHAKRVLHRPAKSAQPASGSSDHN
ncbi:GNAT family N-acetyltransferase [Bremerella cremea]|uniref:GNAT family N-acetyltransferase n=1 Tax=Bremerella cremea TaxID=1031537 RepID=UPI0031EE8132